MSGSTSLQWVNDLADVTGVDKQIILLKILSEENDTTLLTTGPYNGMFSRPAEGTSSGFSINHPVHLTTMLASGFVILKVLSIEGEHLICLDARKKVRNDYASSSSEACMYLSCIDMPNNADSSRKEGEVLYLRNHHIKWHKVVGLYFANAVFG